MLSILGPQARALRAKVESARYDAGYAAGALAKSAGAPSSIYALKGKLYLSSSGWLLLDVPNAVVHGLFAAMDLPGIELPPSRSESGYRAHISVLDAGEVEAIGADKITERGKFFAWQIGPIQEVEPEGWKGMSKVYFARCFSPELKRLRVSYGLSPLHKGHEFHLSVAVKRTGVLNNGSVSKAATSLAEPEIVIDRPKGYQKMFQSAKGPIAVTYPVDYGYLKGLINPQDGEDADVFIGSGGKHFGRYMKGNTTTGVWQPDEHKWYTGLTDDEHQAMHKFWHDQDPNLLRDHVKFPDHAALLADVRSYGQGAIKAASNTSTLPDGRVLDIDQLIERAANKPVEHIPLEGLAKPNRSSNTGFSKQRYDAVDMDEPVLVGLDGTLHDGRHRLARHLDEGRNHICGSAGQPGGSRVSNAGRCRQIFRG